MGSTLAELFDRHPTSLTREDRKKIISALSEAQQKWYTEQSTAKTAGRRASRSANLTPEKARGIELPADILDGLKLDD